ncbi:glycoside hydrolase family 2 TIM barrel-domain containing protein [Lutibacter sp. Hel_I_33_5]|uniref:glycoside hydrolase family 2 protein n=1 Tax=Lutibacter sp. Hel_I_33_5 TaxID=1566289 RepID=UPI0011A1CC5D|nr:glycoside hydrolase family 2 TIM barrel-domain containing protein [Lutibacter sp. Hel_I_33_5]
MKSLQLKLVLSTLLLISGLTIAQDLNNIPEYSKAGFFDVPNSGREVFDFNVGWRFYKGEVKNAEKVNFDDSKWEVVSTPHGLELNSTQASGSNNYQGEAWYRKRFTVPKNIEDKRLVVYFEAIMGKSKVWINGELLTTHFGGFLPFSVDIASKIKKGEENSIAVWADNSDDPSYPPGKAQTVLDFSYFGGIYRDVWLISTNDVYITDANKVNSVASGGLFVHYEDLSEKSVKVIVDADVANAKNIKQSLSVKYILKDTYGKVVCEGKTKATIAPNSNKKVSYTLKVKNPELWSPKNPHLYDLEVHVYEGKRKIIDAVRQRLGIRKIEFRGKDGFYLNNKSYEGKLMGFNRHQDHAYVGNALPNSGQWRDAIILKEAGAEIIRAAHYPADPAFMDACDALGIFFIVATPSWQFWNDKNPDFEKRIYQDIREMVRRDRNHSSVLLWEPILNETHYPDHFAKKVHTIVHEEFPYQGAFTACDSHAKGMEYFDVIYSHPQYVDKHKEWQPDPENAINNTIKFDYSHEKRSIFTREWGDNVDDWNAHNSNSRTARGWGEKAQLIQANQYAVTDYRYTNIETLNSTPKQHVGGSLWHSFDHQRGYHPDPFLGGIADSFRQPKSSYYLFKSQQKAEHIEPMVHIAHEMTPFSSKDVTVFTNCDEVRLIVFEKDTIIKKPNRNLKMPSPIIKFENAYDFMTYKRLYRKKRHNEVTIVAEGIIDGKVVARAVKRPTNRVSKIKLELANKNIPLIANGSDIVTIIASTVDDNGNVKRLNQESIKFEIEGEGEILGGMNIMANPKPIEWGTAPALIRSTLTAGKITVRASILKEGKNSPLFGELTFTSITPKERLLYTDLPKKVKSNESSNSNATRSDIEKSLYRQVKKLEQELNQLKIKQVQKQQTEFERKLKKGN